MRLADLVPADVAEQAHRAVADQARALAMASGYDLAGTGELSDVRHAVHALTLYAQTGQHPEGRPELLQEYMISLAPLYTRASDGGSYEVPELDGESDPSTPWGIVVLACVARDLLARGHAVRAPHLAVLAGVSREYVHRLMAAGEIRARGERRSYEVPAREARRWLGARGVAGFRDEQRPRA